MRLRPPTPEDAPAVLDVLVARDVVDLGIADYTLEDLREEWSASNLDLPADTVVGEDGNGTIVAYAIARPRGTLAVVHPEHEGRGVGAQLLAWTERRARDTGRDRHRQWIGERNTRGRELLEAAGYRYVRSYWRLGKTLGRDVSDEAALPPGIRIRPLAPAADAQAVYEIDDAAFSTLPDYQQAGFDEFREEHLEAHDLDAALSLVAERDGEPVGFLLARRWEDGSAYVDVLAVHPDVRGGGLGSAVLLSAFEGFARAGLTAASLGVASDNPRALRLYERVGMTVRFQMDVYERPVD